MLNDVKRKTAVRPPNDADPRHDGLTACHLVGFMNMCAGSMNYSKSSEVNALL